MTSANSSVREDSHLSHCSSKPGVKNSKEEENQQFHNMVHHKVTFILGSAVYCMKKKMLSRMTVSSDLFK